MELIATKAVSHPQETVGRLNPFNKRNKMIDKNKIQNILKKYGGIYNNINNLAIYQEAMIHESYTKSYIEEVCMRDNVEVVENPDGCILLQESSYERMEFLGDALIESVIVSYLYSRYPDQNEGFLSSLKIAFVNRNTLAYLAKHIGLDSYLIISKTLDEVYHMREDSKILCDIFEAFIAAIYIDFSDDKSVYLSGDGYRMAEKFIINLIEAEDTKIDITEFILNNTNYKDQLIKYIKRTKNTQQHNAQKIEFKIIKTDGVGSHKEITINIMWNNEIIGSGTGNTQKQAEQTASKDALIKYGVM